MQQTAVLTALNFESLPLFKEGKVRSVYDLGDTLLLVASDRVSAFDVILPDGIPHKGEVLTQVSKFWFDYFDKDIDHHLISVDVDDFPEITQPYKEQLRGRSMWVKKTELIEIECVVRGYLVGSGWKDYQETGAVCGIDLPPGLQQAQQLPEPLFTPASKAREGHDENISFEDMKRRIGEDLANKLKEKSLYIYNKGREYADSRGIILADTKFEFGLIGDQIILIDEVLTPDSSRYWPKEDYQVGTSPASFDKQIVRDYLETQDWNKQAPGPSLPESVIQKTSGKYLEVQSLLTK